MELFVKVCDTWQRDKAELRSKRDGMVVPPPVPPMYTLHVDLAETAKERVGKRSAQSLFSLRLTEEQSAFARAGGGNALSFAERIREIQERDLRSCEGD